MKTGSELPFSPLRECRKRRGMTQSDVAQRCYCTTKTVQSWENGTALPSGNHLRHLAVEFGVSTDYLLGLSDVPSKSMDVRALCELGFSEHAAQEIVTLSANYPAMIRSLSAALEQEESRHILRALDFCARFGSWETYFKQELSNNGTELDFNTSLLAESDRDLNRTAAIERPAHLMRKIAERLVENSEKEADNA